jgi:hypothetical protein
MVDRRRSPRLAFSQRQRAQIRTVHEAVVEQLAGDSAEVTTTQPAARGARLVLQCTTAAGQITFNAAEVVSCTPSPREGGMQWRLTLSLLAAGLAPQRAR